MTATANQAFLRSDSEPAVIVPGEKENPAFFANRATALNEGAKLAAFRHGLSLLSGFSTRNSPQCQPGDKARQADKGCRC